MSGRVIAVNARFLTMSATGVQRYANEILQRIPSRLESELRILVPPDRVIDPEQVQHAQVAVTKSWHGIAGHCWEQFVLPRLVRRVSADILWSPCSWGPVAVRRQVVVVHDIAPLTHPQYFTSSYRILARILTRPLARRSALIVTPSTRVREELVHRFGLDRSRVETIAPGIGPPFTLAPLDGLGSRRSDYCLLVGAHDSRKNVEFLLELWPEVHARTGLELHLTYRRLVTTRRVQHLQNASVEGVVTHADPTDEELVDLYAHALCLLWPSRYEGYGFPLLEAMAVGTPFISTDVGAARELVVAPNEQILPLDTGRWISRIESWHSSGLGQLREESARRARGRTWEAAAEETARVLDRLAQTASTPAGGASSPRSRVWFR